MAHRRFTREELERFRDADVPDLVGPGVKLLFIGVNPGLWTAATATPFAHPGNRFYPALDKAGIVALPKNFADGFSDDDRAHIMAAGIGITNLVHRATVRADELSREELRAGASRVAEDVARWRPAVVAVVGITAYRTGFRRPKAVRGEQPELLSGARLWVVPNPSGLNAHDTVASLAEAYAEPARAAGLLR
ncbi:MAG TPA: mismatch-specific DNA-glycosylase [Microbacteriaceae bacterium]|nr:mismatch-specific DNA-glycosylase [Microbacteriaceae bacterium]